MNKSYSKRIVAFIISFLLGIGISVNADANPKMSAEVSKFGDHTIEITFSEEPVSGVDFSSVALFNTNEKAVEGIDARVINCIQVGKTLKIEYENKLKEGCEYAIVLPAEVEDLLGSRYIYFTTEYTPDFVSEKTETFDDNYSTSTGVTIKDPSGVISGSGLEVTANGGKDRTAGLLIKTPQTTADIDKTLAEYSVTVNNLNIPQADTVDVQVIEFDIKTTNDLNIPFVFQFKDSSGKPISFGRMHSGHIAGYYTSSGFSWFLMNDSGRINSAALHIDGSPLSFADHQWKHIKLEWDINKREGKFYVNGQQAAPKTLYNNSQDTNIETGASAFNSIASVNLYAFPTFAPGGTVRQTVTESGVEMFVLDNFRTYGYKRPITVSKVRFGEINGRQAGPFDTVSRLLDNVKVYFDGDANEDMLSNTNIEIAYGGTPVNCEVSYNSDENCAVIKPAIIPESGQDIVVKIAGSSLAIPYQCHITAGDAESVIVADNLAFVNPDGSVISDVGSGEAYVKANIINTTDDTKSVIVSAMGYKNGVLEQYKTKTIEVPAGTIKTIGSGSADALYPLSMTELDGIRASIELMSLVGTSRHPLVKDVFIGTETESADDVTVSGVVSGAGTTDVIIEVKNKTNDDVIYKTQIVTNEDGTFEKKFNMPGGDDAVSGMYRVFVYAEKYFDSYEILYTNPKKAKDVLDNKLKPAIASGKTEDIKDVLTAYAFDLFLDDRYISEATAAEAAKLLLDYSNNRLTVENAKSVINKAVAIAALEKGTITNIFDEAEIFDLENSKLKDVYTANYVTDTIENSVSSTLSSKTFTGIDAFDTALLNQFVFEIIKAPARPGCIEEACALVGLGGYESGAYDSISQNTYTDINAIKDKLDEYSGSKGSQSQTGGGGSGGGSYRGTSVSVSAPTPVTPDEPSVPKDAFTDLNGYEWAKDAILKLNETGVVSGVENGCFEPQRSVNREEFVKMICEAFGFGTLDSSVGFEDVEQGEWYAPYIARASQLGIIQGTSKIRFGVGDRISRQDMAVIIYNALKIKSVNLEAKGETFADDEEIADYAKSSVNSLSQYEIIKGVGDNRFSPATNATRAEAAVIVWRCIEKFSL
ncbi:MAG: S-layer homology domain-containing protein [Monoglobaceae bacterium]